MRIHAAAAKGFERGAADYEKGRPSFPREVLDTLVAEGVLTEGAEVVDLAAGTGKFTRLLFEVVPVDRVTAVEPVAAMRAAYEANFPGARALEGTAEDVPLPEASVDVVTVAQAFHWFDPPVALTEIARVVRPGGWLVMVWNTRDEDDPWTRRIDALLDPLAGDAPRFRPSAPAFAGPLDEHPDWGELQQASFRQDVPMDVPTMQARVASTSYVSALPDDERAAVLERVGAMVAEEGPGFVERYRTWLYWCRRR
jgi:SAM-dependent methyltransferase